MDRHIFHSNFLARPPKVTPSDWNKIKFDLEGSIFPDMLSPWEAAYQNTFARRLLSEIFCVAYEQILSCP